MGHLSYEQSKSLANKTIIILGVITISEVLFALLGKGYLINGFSIPTFYIPFPFLENGIPFNLVSIVMVVMSIVKAYLIIYEFMHMKYEVPGLVKTVLLPMFLLVWAIIAFFNEGASWDERRNVNQERNQQKLEIGALEYQHIGETKHIY